MRKKVEHFPRPNPDLKLNENPSSTCDLKLRTMARWKKEGQWFLTHFPGQMPIAHVALWKESRI